MNLVAKNARNSSKCHVVYYSEMSKPRHVHQKNPSMYKINNHVLQEGILSCRVKCGRKEHFILCRLH